MFDIEVPVVYSPCAIKIMEFMETLSEYQKEKFIELEAMIVEESVREFEN